MPIWVENKRYGGLSDDRFMGVPYSSQFIKGIEIRKNPDSITLSYRATKKATAGTLTGKINAMVTVSKTGDRLFFSSNGMIWIERYDYVDKTLIMAYQMEGSPEIINAYEYNGYIIWTTSTHIHRISIENVRVNFQAPDINFKTFKNGNTNAHPMLELNNKLYIGDGNTLGVLDSFFVYTDSILPIFGDEEIMAITNNGEYMGLYARKSVFADYGASYYWDGVSEAYNKRVLWDGQIIHSAFNWGGVDWVIAGKRPRIYYMNGYTKMKFKRVPFVKDNEVCSISPNSMACFDDLLCIGMKGIGSDTGLYSGVYTIGKEDEKYTTSITLDYPTSNDTLANILANKGGGDDLITFVSNSNGVLYFGWSRIEDGVQVYGIDYIDTTRYVDMGTIISRVNYGSLAKNKKEVSTRSMAFDKLNKNEKIELRFIKNLSVDDYEELTVDYNNPEDQDIYEKGNEIASEIGDFNYLEAQVNLYSGTLTDEEGNDIKANGTTPELKEFVVEFNETIETSNT